jgi:AcrR family transcriptional regulator
VQRPTKDEVRAEFVTIASRRFATDGFHATSLDDIAHEAGYSKAAVLYHFGSKDDLLAAVMQRHFAAVNALVADLEQQPAGPARTEHAITALVDLALDRRPVAPLALGPGQELAAAITRHPDLADGFRQTRERIGRLLVGDSATLRQRVRLTIAFSGLPALLVELRDIPADLLRDPIYDVIRDAIHPKEL